MYDTEYLMKKVKSLFSTNQDQMQSKVSDASKNLLDLLGKLSDSHALYERMKNNLKEAAPAHVLQKLQNDLQGLKGNFEDQWKAWLKLTKQILQAKESNKAVA